MFSKNMAVSERPSGLSWQILISQRILTGYNPNPTDYRFQLHSLSDRAAVLAKSEMGKSMCLIFRHPLFETIAGAGKVTLRLTDHALNGACSARPGETTLGVMGS
ncbi:hypothetical protein RP726_16405 [Candidatus Methylospira mobilis]|uniref:hypothetical protein n=1 Tax=Candidatus Methylospira mobilis TaxID=1808979 RepID=UPI001884DA30|nr:hypothetical protein [Candidatus Methylospira mobilis]WNV06918.1 hypothetical protein RP726_16405 [Candidatus Methylospira mobilis]